MTSLTLNNSTATIGVGFGTAALGGNTPFVVTKALEVGFRKFDTAEADWWYDQKAVGQTLETFYKEHLTTQDERNEFCTSLKVSTKIPPWSLTSMDDIRRHASESRRELVGFCDTTSTTEGNHHQSLDVYYIHAPKCWKGWHPRCNDPPSTLLELKDAWLAMEAVVADGSADRIGLSNIHPPELLDLIEWTHGRMIEYESNGVADSLLPPPPPRIPDVLQIYADPINTASEIREICKYHNIEFVSYSTLGTQHRNTDVNPVLTSPVVVRLATKHNRSVAEVVLSWAIQNDMSVIPRSNKATHIDELSRLLPGTHGSSSTIGTTFLDVDDLEAMDTLSKDYVGEL